MIVTRRVVLAGSAALAAGAVLPATARRAWAVTTWKSDGFQIDSVSDGHLEFPPEFAYATFPEAQRADLIAQFDLPDGVVESPLNVTLLRQGDRVILFDVGSGPDFMPTAGRLVDALAAIDVAPEDVTDVIFTHGHPDHLWGLLDEFDEPSFPDARLAMGKAEFDYWTDPATVDTIAEDQLSFAAGAMRRLQAVADRIETFADGDEVAPNVRAVGTPGHTPGHISFAIGTPEDGLFVLGDVATTVVSVAYPQIGAGTDHDPDLAARTRAAVLARLADEGWTMLGYHLPQGGIGRIQRDGDRFTYVAGA